MEGDAITPVVWSALTVMPVEVTDELDIPAAMGVCLSKMLLMIVVCVAVVVRWWSERARLQNGLPLYPFHPTSPSTRSASSMLAVQSEYSSSQACG